MKTCRSTNFQSVYSPVLCCDDRTFSHLQDLTAQFPESDWISATAALAQYNLRNFDEAQELYEDLLESDPYRIDVSSHSSKACICIPVCTLSLLLKREGIIWGCNIASSTGFSQIVARYPSWHKAPGLRSCRAQHS